MENTLTTQEKIDLYNKLWGYSIAQLGLFIQQETHQAVKEYAENELANRKARLEDLKNNRW